MENDQDLHRADTHDRIELRSDKVRHIIGTRPPAAVRYGTLIVIVVAVMTLIIIAAAIIPYSPDCTTLLQRLLP